VRIAVLGAGSWGTALARLLATGGPAARDVRLWGRPGATLAALIAGRENPRYLPGRPVPPSVLITPELAVAVAGAELLVVALPAASVRAVAAQAARAGAEAVLVACASKGLEEATHLTLDRVLEEELPSARIVLLSGPTFAVEIARELPAAAVAASRDASAASTVQAVFGSPRFRVYTSADVVGVAIGGALKNVIAIAAGCADGLGFGHNARAALITRGLNELGRLAVCLGGDPLTLAGLAGLGDLVLTCTGELSRNRRVGMALATGEPLPAITSRLGQVAEGVGTARIAVELAEKLGVDMPITRAVAAVLDGRLTAQTAVAELLARELGAERGGGPHAPARR
jgi:glycerol-3-phosphate dehydrogenase (NAD(P)+)